MTIRMVRRLAVASSLAGLVTASCGEVPSLPDGVAYISPVILPLPAVAAGDTLRDSLGRAAPLRVLGYTRDGDEVPALDVRFVPTALPADVTIDANGYLVARDTVRSVQLVGRVGDRLQTTVATLQIVPEPGAIARPTADEAGDTVLTLPAVRALPVMVTGVYRGTATPVNGIIVRYRVDSLRPVGVPPGSAILTSATGSVMRPDSTAAVDTTKTAGNATRTVVVRAGSGVETVFVSARARRLRDGAPLDGSPVRFVVRVRP